MPRRGYWERAFAEAMAAAERGEVPVGAVVVAPEGAILASAGNRTEQLADASAHAEILAMRAAAARLGAPRLTGCDLYVTLEPCPMCAGAILQFRLRRVYFAAYDPKGGAIDHGIRLFERPKCLHRPEIYGGFHEQAAGELLRRFFVARR